MIVGSRFVEDGEVDNYVMWRQHDVYYPALHIIVDTCQEYIRLAYSLISDPDKNWESIESYDHRTLQDSHDILAAAWRFRYENEVRQMDFPLIRPCRDYACLWRTNEGEMDLNRLWGAWQCPKPDCNRLTRVEKPDFARHWLDWLLEEVRSWKDSPHLVRLVMQILTNQNQPVGYRAETALRYGLIDRYSDVPWEGI